MLMTYCFNFIVIAIRNGVSPPFTGVTPSKLDYSLSSYLIVSLVIFYGKYLLLVSLYILVSWAHVPFLVNGGLFF